MLSQDDVQELIELTPKQRKAWDSLVRAVKRCRREGVYFYQVLDTTGALNGNNVFDVCDDLKYEDPRCLQNLLFPRVKITDSWADDTHFVVLKK